QGIAFIAQRQLPQRGRQDTGVACLSNAAMALWCLGYPDQAEQRSYEALALARELSHPYSLARALTWVVYLHQVRTEGDLAQERAEGLMALCGEQGFTQLLATGALMQGWALVEEGQAEEGVAQIRQGLAARRATGTELYRPWFLALLAEAYG